MSGGLAGPVSASWVGSLGDELGIHVDTLLFKLLFIF